MGGAVIRNAVAGFSPRSYRMHTMKRRDFLKGAAALGAATLLPAQGAPRRIDVHQHYSSPAYFDLLVKKNAITVNQFRNYTPQRNLDEMDKAGVATAMLSPTAPAVWFGDVAEARKAAREAYEMSGLGPENIQVIELHDCFTPNEIIT